jgi:hypothetical protein
MTLLKNKRLIEEGILFIVFSLSLIGLGITDFSPLESHRYWVLMIILLAIASIGLGWSKVDYQGKIIELSVRHYPLGRDLDNGFRCLFIVVYRAFEL